MEPEPTAEKWPKDEYFIIDVQAHFTNGFAIPGFRDNEFVKNMGFNLKADAESFSFKNFVKEMFFDSDTNMVVISGVPVRERQKDAQGQNARRPRSRWRRAAQLADGAIRPRDQRNRRNAARAVAGQSRAQSLLGQGQQQTQQGRARSNRWIASLKTYGMQSWKWYCHTDPGGSGGGFQCDDDNAAWFYEESRKRGLKTISVHKGLLVSIADSRATLPIRRIWKRPRSTIPTSTSSCITRHSSTGPSEP
jgi:hypothetical protein